MTVYETGLPSSAANVPSGSSNQLPPIYVPPPTGTASIDTGALQAAINYAITGSASDSRTAPMTPANAVRRVVMASGNYSVNAKLKIYSVNGLAFEGSGNLGTSLTYTGTGVLDKLLDVQGCTSCLIGNFSLNGGSSTTNYPTTLLNIDAVSTVASGSSERSHAYDIYLQGTCVNGLAYGASGTNNSQDVYHWLFERVDAYGGQTAGTWSDATRWQNGVLLGLNGGALGNVLSPQFINCSVGYWINGVTHNSVGVRWDGGSLQSNKVDVYAANGGIGEPIVYRGWRGENSGMLFNSANGAGTAQQIAFERIGWETGNLVSDKTPVRANLGGHFSLNDVVLHSFTATDNVVVQVGGSNGPQIADIANLSLTRNDQNPEPQAWLSVTGSGTWTARNIGAIKTDGTNVIGAVFTGPASSADRTGVAANYTATANDKLVAVTSTAAARTITLPTIANANLSPGHQLMVKDESGGAATNNITIARGGTDVIEGGTTKLINTNYGYIRLVVMGTPGTGMQWGVIT